MNTVRCTVDKVHHHGANELNEIALLQQKVQLKFILEQDMKAQEGTRGIAVLFL